MLAQPRSIRMRRSTTARKQREMEYKRIILDQAALEITRRCNLKCRHCLRGEAQNKDMDELLIHNFFKQVGSINSLTLTGGEPSLCPHLVKQVVDSCKYHKVEVSNFYVATNGVVHAHYDDFMVQLVRLWCMCIDNEISTVHISNDTYHEDAATANPVNFKHHPLRALRFCDCTEEKPNRVFSRPMIIKQGRASKIPRARPPTPDYIQRPEDCDYLEGLVYVNVAGDLIEGCDWSYKSQYRHQFGNLYKTSLHKAIETIVLKKRSR